MIAIDWGTRVIQVSQTYLTHVSGLVYELDTDQFRLDLLDLQDGEIGVVFPDTHIHNPPVSIGGTVYAEQIIIINGYTVEFEDGQYAVRLVGSNNNIEDVVVVNQVSVRPQNSAGLVVSPSAVVAPTAQEIRDAMLIAPTSGAQPGSVDDQLAALGSDIAAVDAAVASVANAVAAGTLTPDQEVKLRELWKRLGLDPSDAFTATPTQMRTASGDVIIDLSGDGVSSSTGTRQ